MALPERGPNSAAAAALSLDTAEASKHTLLVLCPSRSATLLLHEAWPLPGNWHERAWLVQTQSFACICAWCACVYAGCKMLADVCCA